jgi:hypothetical protein
MFRRPIVSRILPSQAVSAIEALVPDLLRPREPAVPPPLLPYARAKDVSAALAVLAEVPSELLQLTGPELASLVIARAKANVFVEACARPFEGGHHTSGGQTMSGDVMLAILDQLKHCPDQAVPASTAGLPFIADADLRESLRVDIAEVNRAITDGEWKSATVVCGSIIEALLLWTLEQQAPATIAASVEQLRLKVKPSLEEWDLHHYIEVAADLQLLEPDDTVPQLRLVKNFRNLIHPGRSKRLARVCDQPTALAAVAGLGFLVRDLTP